MEKPDQTVLQPFGECHTGNTDGPTEKPKRALTAYNIFFQHQREQIKKDQAESPSIVSNYQNDNATPHRGKMLFADLARTVARRWKVIDKETKERYDELAAQDKNRYQQEMKQWKQMQTLYLRQCAGNNSLHQENVVTRTQQNDSTVETNNHYIHQSGNIFQDLTQQNTFSLKSPPPQLNTMYNSLSQSYEAPVNKAGIGEPHVHVAMSYDEQHQYHMHSNRHIPEKYSRDQNSQPDSLSELAEKLGPEGVELFLEFFGSNPCI